MLVRCLALSALALAGCASAPLPLAAPAAPAPAAADVAEARPAVSRRHRVARRLSPPFVASSSLRHVTATETSAALVSADYDAAR